MPLGASLVVLCGVPLGASLVVLCGNPWLDIGIPDRITVVIVNCNIILIDCAINTIIQLYYLLPNAVLKVLTNSTSKKTRKIKKMLMNIINILPEEYTFYVLAYPSIVDIDQICDKCGNPEEDEEESIIAMRVKFITDITKIKFDEFKYYCQDIGIIRSFGSSYLTNI